MITFLFGEDSFQIKEYLNLVKQKAHEKGFGLVTLDAEVATVENWREAVFARPLFTPQSVVILKNLLNRGSSPLKEEVEKTIQKPPSFLSLIVWEEGRPDRRTKLFQLLQKKSTLVEKNLLSRSELINWIREQARLRGLSLNFQAVDILTRLVGPNLIRMTNELDKLSFLGSGQPLAEDTIRSLVESSISPSIFEFLDALSTQSSQAILLANRLISAGGDPLHLLFMIAYQVRSLLTVQDFTKEHPSSRPAEVARRFGWHPFMAEKTLNQSRKFSRAALLSLHSRLAELDYQLKMGQLDPADAVYLLVAEQV